eukprot:gene6564-7516_t
MVREDEEAVEDVDLGIEGIDEIGDDEDVCPCNHQEDTTVTLRKSRLGGISATAVDDDNLSGPN